MSSTNTIWAHDDDIHAYWAIPGQLLAGEYPGAKTADKALAKLETLLDAGVTSFVDLTEAGERTWGGEPMRPYAGLLRDRGVKHVRFPIRDTSVIDDAGYDEILAHIRAEIAAGEVVYLHCWGGKGRTGTVVGALLIADEGVGYPGVIGRMQELRAGTCKEDHPVPDTLEQHDVLRRRAQRREA